jgi:putative transposase
MMAQVQKPGWHSRGYLPHFDANPLVQHVVFRTKNSLPQTDIEMARSFDAPTSRRFLDSQLDRNGFGCVFANPEMAKIMQDGLLHFDADRYDLQAWCIMPNHIHVLLVTEPTHLLGQIVKTWKSQATRSINKACNTTDAVFARDYFDRYMRTSSQMSATIGYIEQNSVKAGLCLQSDQWPWSSAAARKRGWQPSHDRMPVFTS